MSTIASGSEQLVALLAVRQPRNPVGWLFLASSISWAVSPSLTDVGAAGTAGAWPGGALMLTLRYAEQSDAAADAELRARRRRVLRDKS